MIRGIAAPRGAPAKRIEPAAAPKPNSTLPPILPARTNPPAASDPPPNQPAIPDVKKVAAAKAKTPSGDADGPDPAVDATEELKGLLRALSLRNACPLAPQEIESLRIAPAGSSAELLLRDGASRLVLNADHALVRALGTKEEFDRRVPYLVSILLTALQRSKLLDGKGSKAQFALAQALIDPMIRHASTLFRE
jgi:hypothetical protein